MSHSIAAQGAGAVVRALVSFALMVWLARVLGPGDFGRFIATLNLAILGMILIEAGWPTLIYRESASRDAHPAHTRALTAHATASMLAATFALAALALAMNLAPLAAALLCMGMVAGSNLVSARMRGEGRFALEAIWQTALRIASAALIVTCVLGVSRAIGAIFLAWGAATALALALAGRSRLALPRWQGLAGALGLAVPFLVYEGLVAFLTKGDMAVLGVVGLAPDELSAYAAGSRLTETALLAFAPVGNVLLRHLRQAVSEPKWFGALARRATLGAVILGACALVASHVFGTRVMVALFGEEFAYSGELLPWIAAMLPFALGNLVVFQALLARGLERRLAWLLGVAAAALLAGLAFGAQRAGAQGSAIAVAGVHALLFVLACISLRAAHARRR